MNKLAAIALTAAAFAATHQAHAEPGTHDGFQFRGAIGGGYLSDSESPDKATISGGAGGFELYAGGFVIPGLSIGGFLGGLSAPGPSVTVNGQTTQTTNSASLTAVWLGPYIDWYPDAQGGFHASLAPELTRLSVNNGVGSSLDSNAGWGIGVGAGYDFWITHAFSIGVLARFNYLSNSISSGGTNYSESTIAPGIFVTFNYH
jgi:hypothetical protein